MAEGTLVRTEEQPQQKAPVPFGRGKGLDPQDLDGAWRCAQLVARSGLAPKGMERPEAILVAAAMGAEIGLSFMQSLQNIAVVNGRPAVWGDALLALVEGTGELAHYEETFEGEPYRDDFAAVVRAVRRRPNGTERRTEERFSVADAKRAGLWGKAGPWQQYPKRMLRYRARGFALRDLFPDVLKGVRAAEEVMDIPEPVTPGPGTPFQVEEVATERLAQPEPEFPAAAREPAPATAPEPQPEPEPEAADPAEEEKQVRRATKGPYEVPRDLLEWFRSEEVRTAGIFGDTLWKIVRLMRDVAGARAVAESYLNSFNPPLSRPDLLYLREEEGLELLERIRRATAPAEETPQDEAAPAEAPEPEPMGPVCEGFRVGELVHTGYKNKRGTILRFQRATNERGPTAVVRMEEGEMAGEEMVFYVSALKHQADAPALKNSNGNGNGWVMCNGPHAGKRVSAAAVCARCDERGDCPEFAAHRKRAAAELF